MQNNFKWKNKIEIKKDHAVLVISKSKQQQYFHWDVKIDLEDVDKISGMKWRLDPKKYPAHWANDNTEFFLLHRFLLDNPDGKLVGHLNGDIYDNRKENLSICDGMSCILVNSKNSNQGVKLMPSENRRGNVWWLVRVKAPNGKYQTVYRSTDKQWAENKAQTLRDSSDLDYLELLYHYQVYGRSYNPAFGISIRQPFGNLIVTFDKKYLGLFDNLVDAIEARNKYIREWCKEQLK